MRSLCCFRRRKKASQLSIISRPFEYDRPKFIIIGAGAAGLACAVKLIDNGFNDVIVLEAESRVGGRIRTVPFGSNFVDLGAQWCHGEVDNVVYEMVKDLDVLASEGSVYVSFECIRSNGEVIPEEHVEKLKDIVGDLFLKQRKELINFEGSYAEYLEKQFFEAVRAPQYESIDREVLREFFENFKKMESSESAVKLEEVSARGFVEYWDCEGDYMLNWKDNGFKRFLSVLTRSIPGGDSLGILSSKVILNAKVETIKLEEDTGMISVTCENFSKPFIATNVVVAVSLGVLKKYARQMFIPQLPQEKLLAIDGLGYGDVFKVFIEFPYSFWPHDWKGFATLWRKDDVENLRQDNLLWLQEIFGFYIVHSQPRVLVAWAVGPTVSYIEKLPKIELQKHLLYLLRRFLTKWEIPEPKAILSSSWTTNHNFCGAYSFRTMFTESLGVSASILANPVNVMYEIPLPGDDAASGRLSIKPTILFAGEATSPHYFSTVHGAVESGWREANRLIGYYQTEA